MLEPDKLTSAFYDMAKQEIESSGEYKMANSVWVGTDGKTTIEALDLSPQQIILHCINTIDSGKCSFMIFGIDMSSQPDQGIEFDDFVLVFQWQNDQPESLRYEQLRIGVINYRKGDEPVIRDIDWNNTYWKDHHYNLVKQSVPFRVRIKKIAQ